MLGVFGSSVVRPCLEWQLTGRVASRVYIRVTCTAQSAQLVWFGALLGKRSQCLHSQIAVEALIMEKESCGGACGHRRHAHVCVLLYLLVV